MTDNIDLLPMPEGEAVGMYQAWSYDQMRDYALANVAHATAPLQAEIERLRADAARGRLLIDRGEWIRHRDNDRPSDSHALLAVRLPYDADLSCMATREAAIDAAMEASNAG